MKITFALDCISINGYMPFTNETHCCPTMLIIEPELPDNFDDDMQWDLDDIMFMLKMEGAKFVEYSPYMEHYIVFSFNGAEYVIDEYDARMLSIGKSIEAHEPYWVIGNNG